MTDGRDQAVKSCDTNACIEAKYEDGEVWIGNTNDPKTRIGNTPAEWFAFLAGAKNGDFDNLVPAIPPEPQS